MLKLGCALGKLAKNTTDHDDGIGSGICQMRSKRCAVLFVCSIICAVESMGLNLDQAKIGIRSSSNSRAERFGRLELLECHWCWRGEAGKAQEGYASRGRCQSLGMAVHISIFISTPGSALFYKERVEMSLEEFVAGERWMTPEEQAEHDYDQCLRAD